MPTYSTTIVFSLLALTLTSACVTDSKVSTGLVAFDPCDRVKSACESAGFSTQAPAGKNLRDDCVKPLANGAVIPGVTVGGSVAAVCIRLDDFTRQGTDDTSPDACGAVFKACRASGYHTGLRGAGNALDLDCVVPLLLGNARDDVKLDPKIPGECMREPEPAGPDLNLRGFNPCEKVMVACQSAPGSDRHACMEQLQAGKPFAGVKLDPAIGTACTKLTAIIQSGVNETSDTPCGQVMAACKAAGYFVGGSEMHQGMQFDCLTPILLGHTPSKVTVDPAIAKACATQPLPRSACEQVEDACKAAGYYSGGSGEGKGLLINCEDPLRQGQPVAGVTLDPSIPKACASSQGRQFPGVVRPGLVR